MQAAARTQFDLNMTEGNIDCTQYLTFNIFLIIVGVILIHF